MRANLLVDTSVWSRLHDRRYPAPFLESFDIAIGEGRIYLCEPILLELFHTARDSADYEAVGAELAAFPVAHCDNETFTLALSAQGELAASRAVSHRVPMADLLIAACAHQHGLIVVSSDADYALIRGHTTLRFDEMYQPVP